MPRLIDLKCANCGASLDGDPVGGVYECAYCHHRARVSPTVQQPAPRIPPPSAPAAPPTPRAATPGRTIASTFGSLIFVGALIFCIYNIWRSNFASKGGKTPISLGELARLGERSQWDDVGGPPQLVTLDGRELVLGRMRASSHDDLYIVAVDADGRERWRAGPYGTYSEGYRSTPFAVAGRFVAVGDFRAKLHVIDLASGKSERAVALTDRASELCGLADGRAWAQLVDRRDLLVELSTGAVRESPRPRECPTGNRARHGATGAHHPPRVANFAARDVLADGDDAIAVGVKSPGTPIPVLVGYDARRGNLRWQAPLPSVDAATVRDADVEAALAGGRAIASYGVGSKEWRLAAFDAATGARQWDVALRPLFAVDMLNGVFLGETRAYVVRTDSLDIFDAKDGRLVATVGNEVYE